MKKLVMLLVVFLVGSMTYAQDETCARPFEHALGTACLPETVERVVALEWKYAEDLLALGIQPIGVADIEGYNAWVDIPVVFDDSVSDVGTRQEPNLELITALEPDLILTASFRAANNFDELSAIAPTLAFNAYPEDGQSHYEEMLNTFSTIASAVNREAEGQAVLDDLNAYFEQAQAALAENGRTGETFILSQGWVANDAASFRLFTDNAMAVQILEQIGLENAWDADPQLYGFTEISFEGFAGIEDTNFFYVAQGDANDTFAESPLWNGLPFVQAGHAYWLGGDAWLFGGPLSAKVLVDTVLEAMGVQIVAEEAAFPVTIEHKFGNTTIEAEPVRVLSLGYSDQDALLALGIVPIAVRYWYGDESDAIFPWADDEANGANPPVLNMPYGSLNYEAILELEPDVIIAVSSGITEDEYNLLSQIAPTVAQSGDYINYGMPWQESIRLIASAVGKSAEAEVVVERVESLFAAAQEAHPEFIGKTVAVAYSYDNYGFYTAEDARGRFFTSMGFVIPEELIEVAGDEFYANVSLERIDLLDQDVLVFLGLRFKEGGREAIEADPIINHLSAIQDGRVIFVSDEYDDAIQFSTVLSLEYALEGILPELTAVFGN